MRLGPAADDCPVSAYQWQSQVYRRSFEEYPAKLPYSNKWGGSFVVTTPKSRIRMICGRLKHCSNKGGRLNRFTFSVKVLLSPHGERAISTERSRFRAAVQNSFP